MKIKNIRDGAPSVEAGACRSPKALARYLELEGWIRGDGYCPSCKHKTALLADPILLQEGYEKKRGYSELRDMSCPKCRSMPFMFKQAK